MFRRELFVLGCLVLGVFAVVAVSCALLARALQYEARMVVVDTLPRLANAGEAISRMNENWERLERIPDLPTASERNDQIERIHTNSTHNLWQEYQKSIFDPHGQVLFDQTLAVRDQCHVLANRYFDLIHAGKLTEAKEFLAVEVRPSFEEYRACATGLFKLSQNAGNQRAGHIIHMLNWLPLGAGVFCVAIFAFGVLMGLRGAFGSLIFVNKLTRRSPKTV